MSNLRISDHALIRWLERTGALDVEALREMLARSLDRASSAAAKTGARQYLILADGLVYLVKNDSLVTVMVDESLNAHAKALSQGHAA